MCVERCSGGGSGRGYWVHNPSTVIRPYAPWTRGYYSFSCRVYKEVLRGYWKRSHRAVRVNKGVSKGDLHKSFGGISKEI